MFLGGGTEAEWTFGSLLYMDPVVFYFKCPSDKETIENIWKGPPHPKKP